MERYKVFINSTELAVKNARVSAISQNRVWDGTQRPIDQTEDAYFVSFDMSDAVNLEIEVQKEFERYEIRPLSRDLSAHRDGNRITVTVDHPMQFTVEIDGHHHALHVFADPIAQKPSGEVIYFGPGEHRADLIWLESNQTLYLEEGAVVYGVVYAKDAENVKIMGRGIIDSSPYRRGNDDHEGGREIIDALLEKGFSHVDMKYHGNLVFNHCKNCCVNGIILRDAPMWSTIIRNDCENIVLDNIKIIGQWRYNSDGINICTSKNVTVKNCFIRSFDDCIITRGAYLEGENGNVENAIIENCVLWCDWGKAMETWCGQKPTEIKNILFKNNRIIHMNSVAMNITVWYGSDHSVVNGVRYENIFVDVDDQNCNNILELEDGSKKYSSYTPKIVKVSVEKLGRMMGLGTQQCDDADDYSGFSVYFGNISYKNVKYFGCKRELDAVIKKHSEIHTIENIKIENCDFDIRS